MSVGMEATHTPRHTQTYDPLERLRSHFLIPFNSRNYGQQFANVYFLRLNHLRKKLTDICLKKYPQHSVCRVLDIDPTNTSVVVGTLYCEMKLKPNVLEDLAREHQLGRALGPRKWVSEEEDSIMLEDESGRVKMVGVDRKKWTLVTGIIVGVMGCETNKGDFKVLDIVYAGVPTQPKPKLPQGDQGLVALVSGLDLDENNATRVTARCDALTEWLNGDIGGAEERKLSKSVGRLVIAGNLTRAASAAEIIAKSKESSKQKRSGHDLPATAKPSTTDSADELLCTLDLPIDIMPGPNDPTIQSLPQQPLHKCLLPKANSPENTYVPVNGPNPWWAEIGGVAFLGTSGQNLDDIYKYVMHDDRLKLATQMLEWSHIAPTAPDTLCCYPFRDKDPFVLTELPHVYFIGNQPEFNTQLVEFGTSDNKSKTRVILVPRFSKTGTVVLVDPKTLECQTINLLQAIPKDSTEPDDEDDSDNILPEKLVMDIDGADDDDE